MRRCVLALVFAFFGNSLRHRAKSGLLQRAMD